MTNTTSNSPSKGLLGAMRVRIAFWARWSVSIFISFGSKLISLDFTTDMKYVKWHSFRMTSVTHVCGHDRDITFYL